MNKTVKYILIAVAIIAALVLIVLAVKYFMDQSAANNQPPVTPPTTGNLIADAFGSLFSGNFFQNLFGGKKCDPNNNCHQKNGDYNLQCCGTASGGWNPSNVDCQNGCDKNKPGYDCNGLPSIDCGFGG